MAATYKAVLWNPHKRIYDLFLVGGIAVYLAAFIAGSLALNPNPDKVDPVITLIRAFGTCAFFMLTIVLAIGPLARLNKAFVPLLYNRRHFGVATFLVGFFHALIVIGWYGAGGEVSPFVAVLAINPNVDVLQPYPFELFGVVALFILFLMAATSHDFWLANLSAPVWKALHMGVYFAYAMLVMHVALGFLQTEASPVYVIATVVSLALLAVLHLAAGLREAGRDGAAARKTKTDWVVACAVGDIEENRAKLVNLKGGESVAVFKYDGKVSAVSNACKHQNGPLAEGKVVDGCITCPWHGYQYYPDSGRSPPPFTEEIKTYRVKIDDEQVFIDPNGLTPGTHVEPAIIVKEPSGV
ncbi:MAG: Rieske 2Fe-2S domain-containing protein [Pseudomonadota bacterium]